jgi:hypothetical protein
VRARRVVSADGDAEAALRRLLPRHALAHAAAGDGADAGRARRARELLDASAPLIRERGLTLIGVAISNLADDLPLQLALPLDAADTELLDGVLDEIRERFGPTAVTRAVLLGRRSLEMPLLPD